MITDFHLHGFRGFREFALSGFSHVNVFVGKNNAGKSSLLEAIHMYATQGDLDVVQSIALRRGEILDMGSDPRMRDPEQIDISHFFNGHKIKDGKMFEIGSSKVSYVANIRAIEESQSDFFQLGEQIDHFSRHSRFELEVAKTVLGRERNVVQAARLSESGSLIGIRRIGRSAIGRNTRVLFITPDSLDCSTLSSLWNNIIFRNEEELIVSALQLLEPRVRSVAFLLSEAMAWRTSSRSPSGVLIGMDGETKRMPLGSLGDGMKRLLAISLALANARNGGYVFIDEIDAGFHYSVMSDLWRLIIHTAMRNNVQVFASTHSLDCLRGLEVIESDVGISDAVSLYTINSELPFATYYSSDEIPRIIQHEVEVR